ncbi:PDZ domain-containing protein [Caldisalinibacter kiritimatiensis]|uniref:Cell division topological determinant MinJ n=1 Tax=Caldisalinibacter kiritimatiensis TaxID=1304284 RepID=R1CS75_9FIRM|nr:PDZ domain-containing protein [Caldisalinibacter kiritimatiensis]EOC99553.1 Cell division topological determinant MinJ [Caldisalinibacter kiritimatiensis]
MKTIFEILNLSLLTLSQILINPIYWVVIAIVYVQYKRIGQMEKKILGTNKESNLKRVLSSTLAGVIGGLIGSIIILAIGITIDADDFKYMLILAILLMLIHPRFICFSYSGGIVSIASLVFEYPKINVSSVMAIVAVLHLVESLLILKDGDKSKVPIFMKMNNKIVGGFNMMRFWPIPFIVLIITAQSFEGSAVAMPDWWPLIRPDNITSNSNDLMCIMIPVMAALGYGDMAISDYPERKIKESSRNLILFSVILLILAIISSYVYVFKYIAALFSPLAHEFLIQYGRKKEKQGTPAFTPSNQGVKILDVLPDSTAEKMGFKSGDIIFRINGQEVNSKYDINSVLSYFPPYIWIDYYDSNGKIKTKDYTDYRNKIRNLGLLVVPRDSSYVFVVKEVDSLGLRLIKWIKNKIKRRS